MGSIKFNKNNNRRKRLLPGQDHYAGLTAYMSSLPSGFASDDRIKLIDDLNAAEALGIDLLCADETKATATITVTAVGADGDTLSVKLTEPDGTIVDFGTYTKITGDNSVTLVATAIKNLINSGTATHGYVAISAIGVVTVTAKATLGAAINTKLFVLTIVGTLTATTAAFTGGVMSKIKALHYHLSELFRINPDAVFYLGIYAVPGGAHTFSEVGLVRTFAQGKIRKMGVFTTKAFALGDVALLQGIYDDSFLTYGMHEIFYAPNFDGVADGDLPDFSAAHSGNVHVVIAQDGAATGAALYAEVAKQATSKFSIGIIGAVLGAISLAKVHENIGWVEKFNMAMDGGELDVPALSNGTLVSTLSRNTIKDEGTFDTKRLIFLKKYDAYTGSYFNDSHGCIAATDDYAYAEDNITIDKAIRGVYIKMLPHVNGPLLLIPVTKKLRPEQIAFLELEGGKALEEMEKAGELSGYVVSIDADQDVAATNKVVMDISNTEIGVSRRFEINIGF